MAGEKPAECSGSLAGDLNFQAPLRGEPADHGWFVGGGSRAARQTDRQGSSQSAESAPKNRETEMQ
jgi:hypothetical protein